MRFKRNEGFRLECEQPLDVQFQLEDGNGEKVVSSVGHATMLDISLHGMKLVTTLDIPEKRDSLNLLIEYMINHHNYLTRGHVDWKKKRLNHWEYGIKVSHDEETQTALLKDLKALAKARDN